MLSLSSEWGQSRFYDCGASTFIEGGATSKNVPEEWSIERIMKALTLDMQSHEPGIFQGVKAIVVQNRNRSLTKAFK